jgi:hypothetical protein
VKPLEPPSGEPPPAAARLAGGDPIDLVALAREVCRRYRAEFPDERERYGDAGIDWCVHDNQHILNWAVLARGGDVDLDRELAWLARVLAARAFPLDRLVRNLEIAAEVVRERLDGAERAIADDLADAASSLPA